MKNEMQSVAPAVIDDDAAAGRMMTEKFENAVRGIIAQVEFGGLLMRKRDQLRREAEERGLPENAPGTGLKAWLKKFAPKIHEGTAHRFMRMAEATANLAKLRGNSDVALLLGAAMDELTEQQKKDRAKIEKLIGTKSQTELLNALGSGDADHKPVKAAATGGDVDLQAWLKKNHPEHAGKSAGRLPQDVKDAWREHCKARDQAKRGDKSRREADAAEAWDEIMEKLHLELNVNESIGALDREHLKLVAAKLKDAARAIEAVLAKG